MKLTPDSSVRPALVSTRFWTGLVRGGLGGSALIAMALSSCTPCQMLTATSAVSAIGSQVVKDPKARDGFRTVSILSGAAAVYTCYVAAQNQRNYAESRGRQISKTRQQTSSSKKGSNLKAIPVPKPSTPVSKNEHGVPPKGKGTEEYMIWDADKDKLFSNEVYEMPADQKYVEIGGKRADVVGG